jgi:hypothetical protein
MPSTMRFGATMNPRLVTAVSLGAWIVVAATIGKSVAESLDLRSDLANLLVPTACWIGWAIGLVAIGVPSVLSLTVLRFVGSLLVPVAIAAVVTTERLRDQVSPAIVGAEQWSQLVDGSPRVWGALGVLGAVLGLITTWSAPVADLHVQRSAYGDEKRFLLRTPAGPALVQLMAAITVAVAGVVGVTSAADRSWLVAIVSGAAAVALGALLVVSLQRMHRRWLVFVPAGLVLHDQVVLGETVMVNRNEINGVGPALASSTALDATGHAAGLAVQIDVRAPLRIVVAGASASEVVETTALLVRPARPGSFLDEAAKRRMAAPSLA